MGLRLVVIILSLPGIIFFITGLWEIINERKFKKQAIITQGAVVKTLASKYGARQYDYNAGTASTSESSGGYLLIIQYTTSNGDTYEVKSLQPFKKIPNEVEVGYSPDNHIDFMIDGFYKSGGSKYYRLIAGLFFAIIPLWYLSII